MMGVMRSFLPGTSLPQVLCLLSLSGAEICCYVHFSDGIQRVSCQIGPGYQPHPAKLTQAGPGVSGRHIPRTPWMKPSRHHHPMRSLLTPEGLIPFYTQLFTDQAPFQASSKTASRTGCDYSQIGLWLPAVKVNRRGGAELGDEQWPPGHRHYNLRRL